MQILKYKLIYRVIVVGFSSFLLLSACDENAITNESSIQQDTEAFNKSNRLSKNSNSNPLSFEKIYAAALTGDASAQLQLGVIYEKGRGTPQNYSKAIEWYKKSAKQGNASAQYNLGTIYHDANNGHQDYAEAMAWYKKAAAQEVPLAQNNIG